MRAAFSRLCAVALIGVIAWKAYECSAPVGALLRAREGRAFERTPNSVASALRVVADTGSGSPAVSRLVQSPSIVFVYHSGCSACARTMAAWAHLARQARSEHPEIGVFALSVEPFALQRSYWGPLSAIGVRLLQLTDTVGLESAAGTRTVPATLVLRDGRVVSVHRGIVGPRGQARILRLLAGGPV